MTHLASGELGLPASLLQATRGWTDEEWEAGHGRLRQRGFLDASGSLELTDAASLAPWAALTDEEAQRLLATSAPFTKKVAKAMFS